MAAKKGRKRSPRVSPSPPAPADGLKDWRDAVAADELLDLKPNGYHLDGPPPPAVFPSIEGWHLSVLRKAVPRMRELQEDVRRLTVENQKFRNQLAKSFELKVASPALEGGVGGRTALQHYGNTNIGALIEHVHEVGVRAKAIGVEGAKLFLLGPVSRDLHVLFAAAAPTKEEMRRRCDLEDMLATDWGLTILSRPDEDGEAARRDFIIDVMRSGVDTVAQELMRRSAEMPPGNKSLPSEDDP